MIKFDKNMENLSMKDIRSSSELTRKCESRALFDETDGAESSSQDSVMSKPFTPSLAKNPAMYVADILAATNLPSKFYVVSFESLIYFEEYHESHVPLHLAQIVCHGDLGRLMMECPTSQLRLHNEIGESILHLICRRRRISRGAVAVVRWLLDEVHLPLDVRDRHGRTPLHTACMVGVPDIEVQGRNDAKFDLIRLLIQQAPELLCFEDSRGKTPLDYVPFEEHEAWYAFFGSFDLASVLKDIPHRIMSKFYQRSANNEDIGIESEDVAAVLDAGLCCPVNRSFHIMTGRNSREF